MQQAMTLSLLGLAAAWGGVVGTQLGKDAIAEINPAFFNEKPEPTHYYPEEQAPYRLGEPSSAPTDAGWGYLIWARAPVCWGCPEEQDGFVDPFADPANVPIPTTGKAKVRMAPDQVADAMADRPDPSGEVERYASFPVTEDEARRLKQIVDFQRRQRWPAIDEATGKDGQPVGM